MSIAQRLTDCRKKEGLSQAQLAAKSGVSQGTIGNIEAGLRNNPRELLAIAKALNVEAQWLKTGTPPRRIHHGEIREGVEVRFSSTANIESSGYLVPLLDVNGSMGPGSDVAEHLDVVRQIGVNIDQLRRQCSFSAPKNLNFITGIGDSMRPTFDDGDVLLVDTGVRTVDVDAVYVIYLNDKLYIKTLQRRPDDSVLMISDNKKYEPYSIKESDRMEVQGKVVLAWNARRL